MLKLLFLLLNKIGLSNNWEEFNEQIENDDLLIKDPIISLEYTK